MRTKRQPGWRSAQGLQGCCHQRPSKTRTARNTERTVSTNDKETSGSLFLYQFRSQKKAGHNRLRNFVSFYTNYVRKTRWENIESSFIYSRLNETKIQKKSVRFPSNQTKTIEFKVLWGQRTRVWREFLQTESYLFITCITKSINYFKCLRLRGDEERIYGVLSPGANLGNPDFLELGETFETGSAKSGCLSRI